MMRTTISSEAPVRFAEQRTAQAPADPPWHARTCEDVLAALSSRHNGLNDAEAASRLALHGLNALPPVATRHPLARLLAQFHNTLIYALLVAAAAAALLGHTLDAAVIAGVVIVNAIVGFLQEGRAENALAPSGAWSRRLRTCCAMASG